MDVPFSSGTGLEVPIRMRVKDIMEREVLTLEACDSLDLASDLMQLGRIRHMPIVSKGRLVGILSQRDLFRAAISSVLHFRKSAEREWLAKIAVQEVMTTQVFSVGPDASLREAVAVMLEKRIGCLPVVEHGRVVGLLSESDCLRHLARLLEISDVKQGLPEMPAAS
jgi:CBS domain-containing membrane protein